MRRVVPAFLSALNSGSSFTECKSEKGFAGYDTANYPGTVFLAHEVVIRAPRAAVVTFYIRSKRGMFRAFLLAFGPRVFT
jgi:hypothetical protein